MPTLRSTLASPATNTPLTSSRLPIVDCCSMEPCYLPIVLPPADRVTTMYEFYGTHNCRLYHNKPFSPCVSRPKANPASTPSFNDVYLSTPLPPLGFAGFPSSSGTPPHSDCPLGFFSALPRASTGHLPLPHNPPYLLGSSPTSVATIGRIGDSDKVSQDPTVALAFASVAQPSFWGSTLNSLTSFLS